MGFERFGRKEKVTHSVLFFFFLSLFVICRLTYVHFVSPRLMYARNEDDRMIFIC